MSRPKMHQGCDWSSYPGKLNLINLKKMKYINDHTKKAIFAGIAVISGLSMVTSLAFAQTNANVHIKKNSMLSALSLNISASGNVRLKGDITAISGSTLSVAT